MGSVNSEKLFYMKNKGRDEFTFFQNSGNIS